MENTEKFKNSKEVIAYVAACFPLCFSLEGEAKPLKIGIFQDLAERLAEDEKVSKTQLRAALRLYTSSWRYLHCIQLGASRVDLDGNLCGELEQEHVDHAKATLAESKARVAERRKEQKKRAQETDASSTVTVVDNNSENAHKPIEVKVQRSEDKKRSARKPRQERPQAKAQAKMNKPIEKPVETRALDATEIANGQKIHVNLGQGNVPATIIEIHKDDVRVQLNNGLQMAVKVEHLRA